MKLLFPITNEEKNYTIGFSKELDGYILAIPLEGMEDGNRYYEISLDEYELNDTEGFDEFVQSISNDGLESARFLFSDIDEENNQSQMRLKENGEKKVIENNPEYQENKQRIMSLALFGLFAILTAIPFTREIGTVLLFTHVVYTLIYKKTH